jgi:hypothetical protein
MSNSTDTSEGASKPLPAADSTAVAVLRRQLWQGGYRPVPVYSFDAPVKDAGKRPCGWEWQINARKDPPPAAVRLARADVLNTGILCDGMRPIDIDIDNEELADKVQAIALDIFGDTICRRRGNSGRRLLPYRAAEGGIERFENRIVDSPHKRTLIGSKRLGSLSPDGKPPKIEVLGHGNQFVAYGIHPSGAPLYWHPLFVEDVPWDALPAVTEDQVTEFLAAVAPLIEADTADNPELRKADPSNAGTASSGNGNDHVANEPQAEFLRVAAELRDIPNTGPADWDQWNRRNGRVQHDAAG